MYATASSLTPIAAIQWVMRMSLFDAGAGYERYHSRGWAVD